MSEASMSESAPHTERERLLRMVMQVAQFFEAQVPADQLADTVVAHLRQQWSPLMRQRVVTVVDAAPGDLVPVVVQQVVAKLKQNI